MIWGETTDQRNARINAVEPQPWFAWYPVTLKDGRSAWLSTISRRRRAGFDWWIYEPPAIAKAKGEGDGGGDAS